jgi:ribosomal protein S27E
MGIYKYVTNRTFTSKDGVEDAGKIKAFVKTDSDTLEGEYKCPECGNEGKINQIFKRPISVKCDKCGYTIKVPKLKGKKKKKK